MLRLTDITLTQFRNYTQQSFHFSERVIGICGKNGSGKTNLLDAIYYLSFSKSYFSRADASNVYHGMMGLRLEANYELLNEAQNLIFILRENNRKELTLNEEPYKRFSDHLGKIPCVMIAPDDISLISGTSEERRKLIDAVISQMNKNYLLQLIDYQKLLQQRNSLLKQLAETGKIDASLLQIIDDQLCHKGDLIYRERKEFLIGYLKLVSEIYTKIAGSADAIQLHYESQLLHHDMQTLFRMHQQKDRLLQRTGAGIHKDDIVFKMQEQVFKTEASQGQRKSLLFALKLAEWQVLKNQKGFTPILLLDDVFEKLDEKRMYQLLHWVCTESDGQVFITDTHSGRLKEQLNQTDTNFQLIEI
ncbi:MAG: DNA replication and repair protein RecF [Chitinophagaceae bacterium]|nr:DNA replication and repair protein RecF [Chitinophagaceae bacterium]